MSEKRKIRAELSASRCWKKQEGKTVLVKTIGSSEDPAEIDVLFEKGHHFILTFGGQQVMTFIDESQWVDKYVQSHESLSLVGPELILGKIFDEVGFNKIQDELFRALVLTRVIYPGSKLKTTEYLYSYKNELVDVERIYRYLDKLYHKQRDLVQQISYQHTLKILGGQISVVFYDVTTLYFEAERPDELRVAGFSKEGKHQHPQIVLGLLVSSGGYPLAYEIFEGNKFEGHTMLPVIESFKKKYNLDRLVVVADAGLLSASNIQILEQQGYQYILGARIKTESNLVKQKIQALELKSGSAGVIEKGDGTRLIVSYTDARATKDAYNRQRGLSKLEKQIKTGKLTKASINNRGYNKYLKMEGSIHIAIDWNKYQQDAQWDGLKGYTTNTQLSINEVIENYGQLWQIEKAFRISKTDLKIRPIYHRIQRRIEAHICIAFCAYKIYKELERQLKAKQVNWSVEKAIAITKTITLMNIKSPFSSTIHKRLYITKPEQQKLLTLFDINFG